MNKRSVSVIKSSTIAALLLSACFYTSTVQAMEDTLETKVMRKAQSEHYETKLQYLQSGMAPSAVKSVSKTIYKGHSIGILNRWEECPGCDKIMLDGILALSSEETKSSPKIVHVEEKLDEERNKLLLLSKMQVHQIEELKEENSKKQILLNTCREDLENKNQILEKKNRDLQKEVENLRKRLKELETERQVLYDLTSKMDI